MWTWILSPIGRKVGLGIAVVLVLFAAVKWYESKIRADEQLKQADKFTEQLEKIREADRAKTDEILQAAQAKQEAAERRVQESLNRESILVRSIASIQQQRSTATTSVDRVRDSDLHTFNVQGIGLRQPADNSPCYTVAEERAIASAITQYPLCQKQVEVTNNQVQEIREQVAALTDKAAAIETKLDAVTGYATRLEGAYTILYNAFPRKRRSVKCLWMFSCGRAKPIPTPTPLDLKGSAPK